MIAALVAIAIALLLIVVSLGDQDEDVEEKETYSGDYMDYYPAWYMGIRVGEADYYLDEEFDLTDPGVPGPLAFYQHRPPELETRSDAERYLDGFGFDVTGYDYRVVDHPKGHSFSKGGCYIGLAIDGRYEVSYQVPRSRDWEPNMTREEANEIAIEYIMDHTGIPDEAIRSNDALTIGSSAYEGVKIESFLVRYQRTIDGHPVEGSGGPNAIMVEVDAQTGAVEQFRYQWVDLEPIDEIEEEARGELAEIVSDFIAFHNDEAAARHTPPDRTANITRAEIIYRNPFGASAYDLYDDCLYYVLMPFVKIEWAGGKGSTIVSPLDPGD